MIKEMQNGMDSLEVFLYDQPIGTILRLADDRNIFAFNESYLADRERPTLSMSFLDARKELISGSVLTRTMLAPFFSNLLPEGHMREYLSKKGRVKSQREFFLLELLGQDLPGAITVKRAPTPANLFTTTLIHQGEEISEPRGDIFRFSLAGVQLKFSALLEADGGLTIPVQGAGGHWIVKLPSNRWSGVPENEYSMMKLAELSGLKVPNVQLIATDKILNLPNDVGDSLLSDNSLAVERFDRNKGNESIHIEDMAQVFSIYPKKKYDGVSYENIAKLLWLQSEEEDVLEFIRVLVFNLLIGNADAHLKNWSLIYPDKRSPRLAPAYDLVSTIAYMKSDKRMGLSLSGTKNMSEISYESFQQFAQKADLPTKLVVNTAEEMVGRFEDAWKQSSDSLPMLPEVKKAIEAHKSQIPLVQDVGINQLSLNERIDKTKP